ncbi:MAG: YcxB family protein [Lachnospiraceae bacterium]
MKEEFDVTLKKEDMFRFNMYHTYHSFQGLFSIAMMIFVIGIAVYTWGELSPMYSVICILMSIVIVCYIPLNLWIHAKIQLERTEALRNTQHFTIDEKGITISQNGEEATLEWEKIYKVVETKSSVLVYSSRVNAYVFPKRDMGTSFEGVCTMMREHLESYRLKLK